MKGKGTLKSRQKSQLVMKSRIRFVEDILRSRETMSPLFQFEKISPVIKLLLNMIPKVFLCPLRIDRLQHLVPENLGKRVPMKSLLVLSLLSLEPE